MSERIKKIKKSKMTYVRLTPKQAEKYLLLSQKNDMSFSGYLSSVLERVLPMFESGGLTVKKREGYVAPLRIDRDKTVFLQRNLRYLRQAYGLTQKDVATSLATTQVVVSRWESQKFIPSDESLAKLSTLFNTPVEELLYSLMVPEEEEEESSC